MSANIQFKLKRSKANIPTSIRMVIFHRNFNKEGRFIYGTGLKVLPSLFDNENQTTTKDKKLLKGLSKEDIAELQRVDARILKLKDEAVKLFNYFTYQNLSISAEVFKTKLDEVFNNTKPIEKSVTLNLNQYLVQYIEDIKNKKRVSKEGRYYGIGSIKNYLTFKAQFDLYQEKRRKKLNFEDITIDFYNDFVNFLNSKNYSANTIGKHISRIKKLMNVAKEEGLHSNLEYQRNAFKTLYAEITSIYLSVEEIEKIKAVDLTSKAHLEVYRDVFLVGCYTAQRISDYSTIKPENIVKTGKGNDIITIIQKKTREVVNIPMMPDLKRILIKYNYSIPKVHEQKLNKAIKEIGKLAEIDNPIEVEEIKGGKKVRRTVPKYEMIVSHTARRSGATNMYHSGIRTIDIMKITGHKRESSFMKYIKVTKEEVADILSIHPYFTNQKLKVV